MPKENQASMNLGDLRTCGEGFLLFEDIITDRGSKYSVAGGHVQGREDIKAFLKKLKKEKRYAKATHNSWAARISKDGVVWDTKRDDGETGAGNVILRVLQKRGYTNILLVVTRWFGGIKLQADRFKHVQDATVFFLDQIEKN